MGEDLRSQPLQARLQEQLGVVVPLSVLVVASVLLVEPFQKVCPGDRVLVDIFGHRDLPCVVLLGDRWSGMHTRVSTLCHGFREE